ncbi:MAG TPA: Flp1 family type IVb pilin [Bacillota bacterium]|nr:Flp1 family type IVb pilin [Bacillota bacterium]HQC36446.1 Flp1 family type IVb pilin [Bacillota bacterium]
MTDFLVRLKNNLRPSEEGMELVQVAILIAIAIGLGLIFREKIGQFIDRVFGDLINSDF